MHSISHSTNEILFRIWIYFLMVGYPFIFLARWRPPGPAETEEAAAAGTQRGCTAEGIQAALSPMRLRSRGI